MKVKDIPLLFQEGDIPKQLIPQYLKLLERYHFMFCFVLFCFACECDQFRVIILSVRDIDKKVIWGACTTMKTIPDCRI